MDWFEGLTGFVEQNYERTREQLAVEGDALVSKVNGKRWGIGRFELLSLAQLREQAAAMASAAQPNRVQAVRADVQQLHLLPQYRQALFQVASQFNMLEMVAPIVQPEHGVTRYAHDATQGPACAIAAGAATIYRNYFVPTGAGNGQTLEHQLDGLADLGQALSQALERPVNALWEMRNGYALCSAQGLQAIAAHLRTATPQQLQDMRGALRIGLHWRVQVTLPQAARDAVVSQAFCSALPLAYCNHAPALWEPLARLVLEAAYEATLLAAVLNHRQGGSNIVALTLLGGGAFGNPGDWILAAMQRALRLASYQGLEVRLVSYGPIAPALRLLEAEFS